MSYNYIVTAQKATAVSHSQTGHFTSKDDLNLLLAKGNRLEVYCVTAEGLKPLVEYSLYGTICAMQLFKVEKETKDWLFVLTSKYHIAIVAYDEEAREIVTKAYGDAKERVGRPTESAPLCIIDPNSKIAALYMYAGILKIVPLKFEQDEKLKAFNIRLVDLYIVNMSFLSGYDKPTLVYSCGSTSGKRCIKSFTVDIQQQDLVRAPLQVDKDDPNSYLMFPVPQPSGGVLSVADYAITWYNGTKQVMTDSAFLNGAQISCYGEVDSKRFLLGDANGYLHMVFLTTEESMEGDVTVVELKLEKLGEVSSPKSITYLDNGVVFIGSMLGDSQLVKLLKDPLLGTEDCYIQVLETFTNLGSIVDMVTVDLDCQDHDSIVTCSGYGRSGSIRIVKSGIGINEVASNELEGIKGVWSLKTGPDSTSDNAIVISFVGQTRILKLTGEELEETEVPGFQDSDQTFQCGNVNHSQIVQITPSSVRLVNQETLALASLWKPTSGKKIGTSAFNSNQVVVAIGCDVHYLEIKEGELKEVSHCILEYEVACIDISPINGKDTSDICVVGLWTDISVRILKLPSLQEQHHQILGGEILPRSACMITAEEISYLLVTLGDGCLLYYNLDPHTYALSNAKRIVLGTKPVILKKFYTSGSAVNVFTCSDRPTIIYSNNKKLLFSSVNMKEVNYMCTLNAEAYPDSFVLATDDSLIIGTVDDIQKLHMRTIPLYETPRRLAYQHSNHVFGVVVVRTDTISDNRSASLSAVNHGICPDEPLLEKDEEALSNDTSSVLVLDENTFEVLFALTLLPCEQGCSIISAKLGNDAQEYFIVGTAIVQMRDKEPKQGRIIVLKYEGGKLQVVSSLVIEGPVYALELLQNSRKLVAVAFSTVFVFNWKNNSLSNDVTHEGCILGLFLRTTGDFILVGDLMRSFMLLLYKEKALENIAFDTEMSPSYMTAIDIIDDETFLGADSQHIFTCQKNTDSACEAAALYMEQPSRICIGDSVNVFRKGSLVMKHSSGSLLQGSPILFGTVMGGIGIVGRIEESTFRKLKAVELSMCGTVKSVGNIDHEVWRSFNSEHRYKPSAGFIDGDLLEKFVDLPKNKMDLIAENAKIKDDQGKEVAMTTDEILKIMEDLSRIH